MLSPFGVSTPLTINGTFFDVARNHLSIYRGRNPAVVEIRFRFIQRALFNFHIRFRLMQICDRLIDVGLRRIFFENNSWIRVAFTFANSKAAWAFARSPSACVTVA